MNAPTAEERTLRKHRVALSQNPDAYEQDLPRLAGTLTKHLKRCGLTGVGAAKAKPLVTEVVELLFEAQGRRPLFHVDAQLPYCWNAPKDWGKNHIRYEWGHLRSRNQNPDAEQPENLALCSARCNQHIQTSMDIDEVRNWLAGSHIATRIDEVLACRDELFRGSHWGDLCAQLRSLTGAGRGARRR